jgi:hypothetical protein
MRKCVMVRLHSLQAYSFYNVPIVIKKDARKRIMPFIFKLQIDTMCSIEVAYAESSGDS